MEIGIIYIAIGKYFLFWNDFFLSSEKYFLPNIKKHYYIFTDNSDIKYRTNKNITVIYQKDMGWPKNTLFRFHMMYKIKDALEKQDYIYFFNANTLFVDYITPDEFIPSEKDHHLICLSWHIYNNKNINMLPYDRNPKSTAYIPFNTGEKYYQGGINGGKTSEYLSLIYQCMINIDKDIENNITAVNNDESHINKYLLNKSIKTINTIYGKPEEWNIPNNAKIIFRDKNRLLSNKYINKLKNIPQKKYSLKRFIHKLILKLKV